MADKRISQLIERVDIANNDVLPIVASGATTTNKVTVSTLQDWMQDNLDVGVTSVGLTMPSAFQVSGSPITTSGNITVTATGTASQYIRGDGTLADFPQGGGGGGASVSYYLNGSVSQGTIGGVTYLEMNKTPVLGAGTDFTINANGYIASFITDAGDPGLLEIPGGNWNFETYFQASSGGGTPSFYVELYKVDSGGTATLIASNSANPELIAFGTTTTAYFSSLAVPTTTLALTDRLALRYYVTHSGRTITLHTENSNLCQIITTFTTGLTALNGLTAQVQNFATGTSGTDFNISSSGSVHTFNLPTASATNRGALSSTDWSTFNAKQDAGNYVTTDTTQTITGEKTFSGSSLKIAANGAADAVVLRNVNGTTGSDAGATTMGFNSSDNLFISTQSRGGFILAFNNSVSNRTYTLQDASGTLAFTSQIPANPVGGTGTTNQIPKFSGTSTLTNSNILDNGTEVNVQSRLFVTSGGQQFVFTPNLGTTSNRIETTGSLPLEIVSGGNITFAAGGATPQITLASTGAVTLTGALNGTTATFLSGSSSTIGLIVGGAGGSGATRQGQIRFGDAGTVYKIQGGEDYSAINFMIGSGTPLSLSSTGAATFSSSVTASSFNLGNGQFLRLTRSSGGLQYDALGIVAGTDNTRLISTGDFDVVNGSLTSQFKVAASGNVGIGTSVFPFNPRLAVNSTGQNTIAVQTTDTAQGSTGTIMYMGTGATTGNFTYGVIRVLGDGGTTASNLVLQPSSGNVGIGTTSPSYALDVNGSTNVSSTNFYRYNGDTGIFGSGSSITGGTASQLGIRASSDILFATNGATERMRITSGGNVGIGTASPGQKLAVSDSGGVTRVLVENTGNAAAGAGLQMLVSSSGTTVGNGTIRTDNADNMQFFNIGGERMRITSGGTIFMYNLGGYSSSNADVRYDTSSKELYYQTSSIRYKTDINDLESSLDKINLLRPVRYQDVNKLNYSCGLIAEEVYEIIPDVVFKKELDGFDEPQIEGINYSDFVPFLIKAMQEQQQQIKSLTEQVEALKSQING